MSRATGTPPALLFLQLAAPCHHLGPSSTLTSAKVKAQRPQSGGAGGQSPAQPPRLAVGSLPGQGGRLCHPNVPQAAGRSVPSSHRDTRPGWAAASCRGRRQAGYPSTGFGAASLPGEFLCRALCSQLPHQRGRGALGALQGWVALGKSSGPWERKEGSPGTGWRRGRAQAARPRGSARFSQGGHPSQGLPRLGAGSPPSLSPHHCRAKTGALGAAKGYGAPWWDGDRSWV